MKPNVDKPNKGKYQIKKVKNSYVIYVNGNRIYNSKKKDSCIHFYRSLTNFPFTNDIEFDYTEFENL